MKEVAWLSGFLLSFRVNAGVLFLVEVNCLSKIRVMLQPTCIIPWKNLAGNQQTSGAIPFTSGELFEGKNAFRTNGLIILHLKKTNLFFFELSQ